MAHPSAMKFRPCIDIHKGKVKQIVGSTLTGRDDDLKTNFVSELSAAQYAEMYRKGIEFAVIVYHCRFF